MNQHKIILKDIANRLRVAREIINIILPFVQNLRLIILYYLMKIYCCWVLSEIFNYSVYYVCRFCTQHLSGMAHFISVNVDNLRILSL